MNIMQNTVLLIMGHICGFEMWRNTPSSTLFYMFFWYTECFIWFALFTSTFVSSLDQANQISYSLILANILVQCAFTNCAVTLKLFYSETMMQFGWIKIVKWILECWPTYDFSLAWGLLAIRAGTKIDYNTLNWVNGDPFRDSDWYAEETWEIKTTHDIIHSTSINHLYKNIAHITYFLMLLTWYFDHVLSSNRGVAYPLTFPFQKSYWKTVFPSLLGKEQVKKVSGGRRQKRDQGLGHGLSEAETLESVNKEKTHILEDEKNGRESSGLRVVGLEKIYNKYPFGIKSTKDVHAIQGIYLDVPKNELLCLLGHNGAGKSTLFNILTGIIGPTEGYAKICGLNITSE